MRVLGIILAMSGSFYNDVLSLIAAFGTCLMFLGSIPGLRLRPLVGIGEWSLAAVFFGILFQTAMAATGLMPEQIGFLVPMRPAVANGLFGVSLLFLAGYWRLRRLRA
jgi:hypothetical protein